MQKKALAVSSPAVNQVTNPPLHRAVMGKEAQGVNTRDSKDRTPLHHAAKRGDSQGIQALIEAGAPVDARDNNGMMPLHHAAKRGDSQGIQALIEASAPVDARDKWDLTPLHYAARNQDNQGVVQALIEASAPVDARDEWDMTPLHWAAQNQDNQGVQALIDAGAPVDARDNQGMTPFHRAIRFGYLSIVRVLLRAPEIEVDLPDSEGDTPIETAFELGRHDIVRLLQQRGAQLPAHLQAQPAAQEGGVVINGAQSVHTASVHQSVSDSARRLVKHFARADVAGAQQDLQQWAKTLPSSDEWTHRERAAKAGVAHLFALEFEDVGEGRSYLTLHEAMGYVWLALKECAEEKRLDHVSTSSRHEECLQEFVKALYEIQRGYNLDVQGRDDGLPDRPTCASGSFNKLMTFLVGRHLCANLTLVTCETITAKAQRLLQALLHQQFSLAPLEVQAACYGDWEKEKHSFFEKYLQAQFTLDLEQEFGAFAVTDDLRQHLTALCGEYPPLHHLSLPAPSQKTEAEVPPVNPSLLFAYQEGVNNASPQIIVETGTTPLNVPSPT